MLQKIVFLVEPISRNIGIFMPGIVAILVDYVISKPSTCMSKKWQFGIIGSDR